MARDPEPGALSTQRAKDPDGFLALFRRDALWTIGHGKGLLGLGAIAEFTRAVLPAACCPRRAARGDL